MFRPVITARLLSDVWPSFEQSSNAGSGSVMTVPMPSAFGDITTEVSDTFWCVFGSTA